jgi:hypothetical protein
MIAYCIAGTRIRIADRSSAQTGVSAAAPQADLVDLKSNHLEAILIIWGLAPRFAFMLMVMTRQVGGTNNTRLDGVYRRLQPVFRDPGSFNTPDVLVRANVSI